MKHNEPIEEIKFRSANQGSYDPVERSNDKQIIFSTKSGSDKGTWICPYDDTVNAGDKCVICGHPRHAIRNKKPFALYAAVLVILLIGSLVGQLIPEKQPGTPVPELSVTIQPATTPPAVQHQHNWEEATYNSPKFCAACGKTEGSSKVPSNQLNLMDIIRYSTASSIYDGDLNSHGPENMYDQDVLTNWTEGTSGAGIGEYATLYFDDTYAIKELTVLTGSHYKSDYFTKNNRPSAITLYFSDGSSEYIRLDDTRNYQTFTLSEYHYADYVEIIIEEVYSGTAWNDTIIAEIDFAAYAP